MSNFKKITLSAISLTIVMSGCSNIKPVSQSDIPSETSQTTFISMEEKTVMPVEETKETII